MDQGTLQGIGTLLALLGFSAICVWAYSGRNKARFDEAAQLPFADDLPVVEEKSVPESPDVIDDVLHKAGSDKTRSNKTEPSKTEPNKTEPDKTRSGL